MDAARWEQVQSLFHQALDRPRVERNAWLDEACAGDEPLLHEVLGLLELDEDDSTLLDRGIAAAAYSVLRDGVPPGLRDTAFGPYRIKGVLGEGGMGVVYLASREDLQSVAAIKILRDAWLSPARRERFALEQRTLAQLNHPSIARLYDADTLPDGTPWFVMEYVEGVPLTEHCRSHGSSVQERLRLFRAVCEAVLHAHHHAVIHRDLKPSNILVAEDGTVKLLDFGIAKHLVDLDVPEDQTRTGLRLMTPAYAAPEQLRGDQVGLHTDVYSLGIILYELLTERVPFDLARHTPREVEQIIAEHEPVKPSAVARATARRSAGVAALGPVPSWTDLDVLCLTAMHKDPRRRYRTVEALIRDIDHYLAGQPLEARPDTLRYRLGKFIRRNRAPVTAASLAVAGLVGLTAFYTVRLAGARDSAVSEAERAQRMQAFTLNLFRGGDDAVGPAESLRVITLLDRGVEEARTLDREPLVQAELRHTLGGLYQRLGNFDRSDSLLTSALAERRALLGNDHPDVGESLVALALLRVDQARLEEAEQLVREGAAIVARHETPGSPRVVRTQAALGRVLQERGSYDESIAVLEGVVRARQQEGDTTVDLAGATAELANTHFYAGHNDTSDSLNAQVLAMTRQLHGPRHPLVAEVLINLGATQFERGNYPASERLYRQALDISRPWYGNDHPTTASHATMLGRALVAQERFDEATGQLQDALVIRERVYGPNHPQVASTINELGNIAVRREQLDAAERYYARMVDIYKAAYNDRHYLIGTAESNLAGVYLARKQYLKAQELYRDALRRFADTQGADHLNSGIAHIKLGRALIRDGQFLEGSRSSLTGYEIVNRQASPGVSFLRAARRDLIVAYDSLRDSAAAARFRAEIADTSGGVAR